MRLSLTTWNINSVRLRIDLVARFLKAVRPDVLCLQETKCPDDKFPHKRFARLGYAHPASTWQPDPSVYADIAWPPGADLATANLARAPKLR